MIHLAVMFLAVSWSSAEEVVPLAWLQQKGYQLRTAGRSAELGPDVELLRTSDGAVLSIAFHSPEDRLGRTLDYVFPGEDAPRVEAFLGNGGRGFMAKLPSRFPLGTDARWRSLAECQQVYATTEYEFVSVSRLGYRRTSDGKLIESPVQSTDNGFVEAVARLVFARVIARRVGPLKQTQLNGRTALMANNNTRALDMIDVKDWAAARGWTCQIKDAESATLTKGAHKVVVPLASASIQVDGKWIDLPDAIAEKEGHWLVPLESLEKLPN